MSMSWTESELRSGTQDAQGNRIGPRGHFDPKLFDVFANDHEEFAAIWLKLAD